MTLRPEPSPELLKRFLAGRCSAEEEETIALWYQGLGKDRKKLQLSPEDEKVLKLKLWSAIRDGVKGTAPPTERPSGLSGQPDLSWQSGPSKQSGPPEQLHRPRQYKRLLAWSGAAAACILLLLLFPGPESENRANLPAQENPTVYKNTTGKTLCIALPDASLVWLQPMGTLTFTDFRQQRPREVTLDGEAYFEVTSDPGKPFVVYTGEVTTRVLGTKFNIKAKLGEQTVEVEVTEGTVALSSGDQRPEVLTSGGKVRKRKRKRQRQTRPEGMRLTANQKAVYDLRQKTLVKLVLPEDVPPAFDKISEKTRFEFNNTPMKKVTALLEKAYHITIEMENEALNRCTLTASLNEETLDTKLELICKSIGAAFKRTQNTIIISGSGCPDPANSFL